MFITCASNSLTQPENTIYENECVWFKVLHIPGFIGFSGGAGFAFHVLADIY